MINQLEINNNEQDRLSYLYEKYGRLLYNIASSILHSKEQAEDALQSTFVTAIDHKSKILNIKDEDFKRWSIVVIKSGCFDILRKFKREPQFMSIDAQEIQEIKINEESMDEQISRREEDEFIRKGIAKLEEVDKNSLLMKYALEMSSKEIGNIMGLSEAQVNGKLNRAKIKARKVIKNGQKSECNC